MVSRGKTGSAKKNLGTKGQMWHLEKKHIENFHEMQSEIKLIKEKINESKENLPLYSKRIGVTK